MSDVSAMVCQLIAAGCAPDVAAQVVASAFVAGAASATFRGNSGGIPVDETAEKRRAYDRERKRKSTGIPPDSTGVPILPLSKNIEDKKERGRGKRIPPEFPTADDRSFAKQLGWSEPQIESEAANFRDYWIAKPGSGGVKLDWPATWRKWIRSSKTKPAGISVTPGASNKISVEDAVAQFAKLGSWSRYSPVTDVSQVPTDLLAKHGLSPDGRKVA